jgi:hypothetical protein
VYQPALLSVDDDAARSFKLLVMCSKLNGRLLTQTFSSQEGEWGAARKIHINNNLPPGVQGLYEASSTAPAVVWRSVHWLCYTNPVSVYADRELIILAVRAESACANVIKLPQELLIRMGSLLALFLIRLIPNSCSLVNQVKPGPSAQGSPMSDSLDQRGLLRR